MSRQSATETNLKEANGSYLFIGFAVLGLIVIVLTKLSQLPVWVLPFPPLILMILYAAIVYRVPQFRLPPDQIGDNSYYLGFLYTLTSLIAALVRNLGDPESIIGDFGIAIITTMAGVAMRVFFNQLNFTPDQAEQLVSKELSSATREMLSSLDMATDGFTHYNERNQRIIAEGFDSIRREIQSTMQSLQEGLNKTQKSAVETISKTNESALQAYQSIEAPLSNIALNAQNTSDALARVDQAIDNMAHEIQQVTARISETKMPDEVLGDSLKPAIAKLTKNLDEMDTRALPRWFMSLMILFMFLQTSAILGMAYFIFFG